MQKTASPVVVVHVLPYECVRLYCAIRVHLRHIHVIYEVDQLSAAWRSVVAPCFLLKRLFQHRCITEEQKRGIESAGQTGRTLRAARLKSNIYGVFSRWRVKGQHGDI